MRVLLLPQVEEGEPLFRLDFFGMLRLTDFVVRNMTELYRRNPQVEEAPLGSDLMLFDPVKSNFFVLNATMAYLWRNCDGEKSLDRIVESIPREFADAETYPVATEMKAALDELVSLGMVTRG